MILALDPDDGRELWRTEPVPTFPSPLLVDDRVIMGVADNSYSFYAVDAHTGLPRWTARTCGTNMGFSAKDGMVLVSVNGGCVPGVWAFDQQTGALLWRGKGRWGAVEAPLIIGQRVIVNDLFNTMYAFDLHSGVRLWRTLETLEPSEGPPVASLDGASLLRRMIGQDRLDKIDVATGAELARFELPLGYEISSTLAAVPSGVLFTMYAHDSGTHVLAMLNTDTGAIQQHPLELGQSWAEVTASGGRVHVNTDEVLYTFTPPASAP